MPLVKLKFKPGVDKEGTDYENTIGWYDTDKVRFRMGQPEKIGGWVKRTDDVFKGTARALLPWTALNGTEYIGIGTNSKLYIEDGSVPADVTPIRASSTINTNPFSIAEASAVVTVTDTAHGAVEGDYVTYSGATSSDGTLTAAVMNAEYEIDSITDDDTYRHGGGWHRLGRGHMGIRWLGRSGHIYRHRPRKPDQTVEPPALR